MVHDSPTGREWETAKAGILFQAMQGEMVGHIASPPSPHPRQPERRCRMTTWCFRLGAPIPCWDGADPHCEDCPGPEIEEEVPHDQP